MKIEFLYGKNAVYSSLLNGKRLFRELFVYANADRSSTKLEEIEKLCAQRKVKRTIVQSRNRLSSLAGGVERQHQGLVLECSQLPIREVDPQTTTLFSPGSTSVFLDRVTDAHNVGSIARSMVFFGMRNLLLSDGCCPINSVAAASSAGAVDALRVMSAKASLLERLHRDQHIAVYVGCVDESATPLREIDVPPNQANVIVLGNEGVGARQTLKGADFARRFFVRGGAPGDAANVDSLSVAVSAGVVLNHFCNARRKD
jgi:tRNA G18 (ribose-2'-O)-methylase SpoU